MTVNLLHRKKGDGATLEARAAAMAIAIGEIGEKDGRGFYCPSCGIPVADGTWKCPSCSAKFVLGVTAKRASALLAVGFAVGILSGGVVTASALIVSPHDRPADGAVVSDPASVATATEIPRAVAPSIAPTAAVTALTGTAVINGRISADAATLATTLADRKATTTDIAQALRSLSADAAQGIDLAARLATWREADPVRGRLDAFYRTMSTTASLELGVSLDDGSGYRRSATEMLGVVRGLSAVDGASRAFAATVGLDLPPVSFPAAH